jgi:hypothetical protein
MMIQRLMTHVAVLTSDASTAATATQTLTASQSTDPGNGETGCSVILYNGPSPSTSPIACPASSTLTNEAALSSVTETFDTIKSTQTIQGVDASATNPLPTDPQQTINGGNGDRSLSGGAVAGVAIGCLIAGAAIAAIVLVLLFRRRRNKQAAGFVQHHLPYNGTHAGTEKAPIVTTAAVASSIDNLIPQPVEDEAITKEVSRLRDNIKNHVRTYYRFDPVGHIDIPHAQLAGLAAATGISTAILAESLLNPAKRDSALRLYLAWAILSRCEGNRLPSLLPGEIAALTAAVPTSKFSLILNGKLADISSSTRVV